MKRSRWSSRSRKRCRLIRRSRQRLWGLWKKRANSPVIAISRDDYDARRWRDEVADSARSRWQVSRSVIINAVDGTTESANRLRFLNSNRRPPYRITTHPLLSSQRFKTCRKQTGAGDDATNGRKQAETIRNDLLQPPTSLRSSNRRKPSSRRSRTRKPIFEQPIQAERSSRIIAGA